MKSIKILLISIFFSVSAISCHAQREFKELSKLDGATSIYIGKTMLKLAKSSVASELNFNGVDCSELIDKLNSVEILVVDDERSLEQAYSAFEKLLSETNGVEDLVNVTEGDETTVISGKLDEATNCFTRLFISQTDAGESNFIILKGNIPLELLQEAIEQ